MTRTFLHSKIKHARITASDLHYDGSITVDGNVLHLADILPFEQVHVLDVTNGARFVTYAIEGAAGAFCVNGAAANLVSIGDEIIILTYAEIENDQLDRQPIVIDVSIK
jgi:aspartate 1-decarboxylase